MIVHDIWWSDGRARFNCHRLSLSIMGRLTTFTIFVFPLIAKLTPLCHPIRTMKPKPIVIARARLNVLHPSHVYFPTHVSYTTLR